MEINSDYQIVSIDKLKLDPENPKIHPDENIEQIKASIKAHGFINPLAVHKDTGIIVAGNGTFMAAKALGYTKVPVIYLDCDFNTARSYGIAVNRIPESSKWDLDAFNKHIKELNDWDPEKDWKSVGFDDSEIKILLDSFEADIIPGTDDFDSCGAVTEGFKEESKPEMGKSVKVTSEQRSIFDMAIAKMREQEEDPKISEGRVLELLAADYIS